MNEKESNRGRCVIVVSVETPSVIYIRPEPRSPSDQNFIEAMEAHCRSHADSEAHRRANDRRFILGHKYFVLEERRGDWRRAVLTTVHTDVRERGYGAFLIDEARSIEVTSDRIIPMPVRFAEYPPLVKRVVVDGLRPCSLVTDTRTCETRRGPVDEWDLAADCYARRLFLTNPDLLDIRLIGCREDDRIGLVGDFVFDNAGLKVLSYAGHLRQLQFAYEDRGNTFAQNQIEIARKNLCFRNALYDICVATTSHLHVFPRTKSPLCEEPVFGDQQETSARLKERKEEANSDTCKAVRGPSKPSSETSKGMNLNDNFEIAFNLKSQFRKFGF